MKMDAATLAVAAGANAKELVFLTIDAEFDQGAANALLANDNVSSLTIEFMKAHDESVVARAAHPRIKNLSLHLLGPLAETKTSVENAWVSAGKARVDLVFKAD